LLLIDVTTGQTIREYQGVYRSAYFSLTEGFVYAATDVGTVRIFDTFGGQLLLELRGPKGAMFDIAMTPDESILYTSASDGSVLTWDIESHLVGTASTFTTDPFRDDEGGGEAFLLSGNSKVSDKYVAVGVGFDGGQGILTDIYDIVSHEFIRQLPGGVLAFSPDGSQVAIQIQRGTVELSDDAAGGPGSGGTYYPYGPLVIVDVESGETTTKLKGPCVWYGSGNLEVPGPDCFDHPEGWVEFTQWGAFSPDGSVFAIGGQSGYVVAWDTTTGEIVGFVDSLDGGNQHPWGFVAVAFSPDGTDLVVGQWNAGRESVIRRISTENWEIQDEMPSGQKIVLLRYTADGQQILVADDRNDIWLIDSATWTRGASFSGQQGSGITDVELSPDGRFAVVASVDGTAWMWDLQTRRVALKLNFPGTVTDGGVRNVEFIDDSTLLVGSRNANVLVTLDPEILLDAARASVTRSFTAQECETYNLDLCPTLEEIQNGS
jgi:WD40 repeat protein